MAMVIDNLYNIGDVVYLRTDTEQLPRIIFEITIRQNSLIYGCASGTAMSEHYDFELQAEKDLVIGTL